MTSKKHIFLVKHPLFPIILLIIIIFGIYYKFFLLGKIPFPADLLVGSYYPWLDYYKLPVQNPLISDVFSLLFVWKYIAIDQIRNLEWPFWNPYSFTGTPLLANYQSAVLYPLNLLLLLPQYIGWGLFIFFQSIISALGMYLLLSLWLSSKLARLTGSIIFTLGGLMTTWTEFGTAVHGISWLPISLFLIEKYGRSEKARYPLILCLTLTLIILSGNPQISLYSYILVILFTLVRLQKNFIPILLAIVVSIMLSTAQLLPSFELVQKSIRATENFTQEADYGLLPLKDFIRFFIADFYGNPVTRNYWGFLNYFETSSFVGSLALPLVLFAIVFLKKNRITYFFLSLLALSLLLTFNNPLSYFINSFKLPLLTKSYASRILFVTNFTISILAAFALNQIIAEKGKTTAFRRCLLWSWAAFTGTLLGTIIAQLIGHDQQSLTAFRNSLIPVVEISIILFLFIVMNNIKLLSVKNYRLQLLYFILFTILTIDLSRYFLKFNPFVSEKLIFPETAAINFLLKQPGLFRVGREHAEILPPNSWAAYKLQSVEGYDVLHFRQYNKLINFINGGSLLSSGSSRYAELTNYQSAFIDAANVKYFMMLKKSSGEKNISENLFDGKTVFKDGSVIILENLRALPRVYFAQSFFVAPHQKIEEIISTDTSFDPRHQVALSDYLDIKKVSGKGFADIIEFTPNQVNIRTQTQKDEILILADQFDEGWKAKIDGQDTKIARANLIFRAVKVPGGSHEIIFYYWPQSFKIGLDISLTTLMGLILITVILANKRQL